jgi:hypothetical protein
MLSFPFNITIINVWNGGSTLQNINLLFGKFNFNNYLPGIGFGTFLLMLYSLIFVIILVILDILIS